MIGRGTDSFVRTRMALLGGAMLVIVAGTPLAVAAVTAPEPPAAPAAPSAPQLPAPPVAPHAPSGPHESNVVIVERHGPDGESDATHVRTIMRDGRTFVFKTDHALSDEEVERRVAEAESRLPPLPPLPPKADNAPTTRWMQQRVIVLNKDGEGATDVTTEEGEHCNGRKAVSNIDTSAEQDGKVTRVRIRMCGSESEIERHAMAEAITGIRQAYHEIATDKSLSNEIRSQVLKELDAELARLRAKS